MGTNLRLCTAKTRGGHTCPHYVFEGSDFCRLHGGPELLILDKTCREEGCEKPARLMEGVCRRHLILSLAEGLRTQDDLERLIEDLCVVHVRSKEARAQARQESVLRLLERDADAVRKDVVTAQAYGCTAEQIDALTGPLAEWLRTEK